MGHGPVRLAIKVGQSANVYSLDFMSALTTSALTQLPLEAFSISDKVEALRDERAIEIGTATRGCVYGNDVCKSPPDKSRPRSNR